MRPRQRSLLIITALACTGLAGFQLLGSGANHAAAVGTAVTAAVTDTGGATLSHRSSTDTGALGVTFSFETNSLAGGPYTDSWPIHNVPMYEANTAGTAQFWLNYVEQLVSAGVDYVAVDTRGYIPGSTVPNEGGDPRELTQLVNAINQAGDAGKLKIAAFDDTPASMTDKMNQIVHGSGGYSPPFDFSVTTGSGNGGYKYLWNNDLEAFFQAVPSSMLYKVNGQPLIYLWSDNSFAFANQGNGNSARYLSYVRSQAESTFNENPYFVVDDSWVKNDSAVAGVVQGEDDWFGVPTPTYTNQALGGQTFGATVPSFEEVDSTANRLIDPNHGNTFVTDLTDTVGKNDTLTLVEGFSDWPENAAMWRTEAGSYTTTHRDYPGQDINILRRYSKTPFPSPLTVQAETADTITGAQANPFKVYRPDLGVQTTTDTGGGWNVGGLTTGETETWDQVPMQGTENLSVRVASPNTGSQFRFVIDGVTGPTITVPNTGGWQTWQTVSAGSFTFNPGTYHTVEIQYLTGGFNVNWWQATAG
ncbi:DUF5010 domain-containing protein [Actinospica sp.]|jgi:hypothetical protein|uniref:DUF5010 domain-containing protein n=1 Tax=Actinospica sp. TaxID=1872142 RepID=UPI002B694577|nr:DUF5010 domain-containing protein [Actinospica sp.]HWG22503.1 DUF5010 domain-containing protein [Actinospica sp.]